MTLNPAMSFIFYGLLDDLGALKNAGKASLTAFNLESR